MKVINADAVTVVRVRDMDASTRRASCALMQAAFGDEAAFLDRLYAAAENERYLYIRTGGVAAGCFVFDATLYAEGKTLHGGYLYGLCTAPPYRGRGLAHALVRAAARCAGDFLLTVPASLSLFDFYRRAGFDTALPGCVAVGGDGDSHAPIGLRSGGYADAMRAAARYGGLLLCESLFSLSLKESKAEPCVAGDAFCAVRGASLLCGIGVRPDFPIAGKALLYGRNLPSTDGIFADLLLEV